MAAYLVEPAVGAPGDIHTTQQNAVGLERKGYDANGKQATYIYLAGAASIATNEVVAYQPGVWTAVRIATGVKGSIAISTAAIINATWGWFLIVGTDVVTVRTACTSNVALFIGGVTGFVDVAAVKGDQIFNAFIRNAAGAVGSAIIQVNRAFVGASNESTG
jgi:hypothetical protein